METAKIIIHGIFGFLGVVATGYCTCGILCVLYGGMTFDQLPDWFWTAAVGTAIFAGAGVLALLGGILELHWERQEKRRLGYVTLEKGKVVYRK